MQQTLITVLVVFGVIGMYFVSYILNKNTPIPEGIEPIEECETCNTTSCAHHPEQVKSDLKELIQEKSSHCHPS